MADENKYPAGAADKFYQILQKGRRGNFKINVGLAAGVGKTYRMLQEAHQLLSYGIDVVIGYVEVHDRAETKKLLQGIPEISRKNLYYKGKELEELDLDAVLIRHPEVVIIDELAHTNAPGSRHKKRYLDVEEILFNGISVISAMNIQHIESLNTVVEEITKIKVNETVPDKIIGLADEVVNIDITADELIQRLQEGKIYSTEKIKTALNNFFKREHLLQLRELALREVANAVERKIGTEVSHLDKPQNEILLVCLGNDPDKNDKIIRRTARMADRSFSKWYTLYIDTPNNSFEGIDLRLQRYLMNNFNMATGLGAITEKVFAPNIADGIIDFAKEKGVTKIVLGKPSKKGYFKKLTSSGIIDAVLSKIESDEQSFDVEILA